MLHDPGSYTAPSLIDTIDLSAGEKDTLKNLGEELAGIVPPSRFTERRLLSGGS